MSLSIRTVLPNISPIAMLSSLPACASSYCPHPATLWQRWWSRKGGVWFQDQWYCSVGCFHAGLVRRLQRATVAEVRLPAQPNRLPLGLVLLSQGDISSAQLRRALELQKKTKSGRVGEWLVRMGAVSEQQVTAALAVQQRCPVFSGAPRPVPQEMHWPRSLADRYRALPVFFNPIHLCLYVGFLEQVDHGFLYSLEQMLRCRTQPCILPMREYVRCLQLWDMDEQGESIEIAQRQDPFEMAQTICNYAQQTQCERCLSTFCEGRMWIRLQSAGSKHLDLLLARPATC